MRFPFLLVCVTLAAQDFAGSYVGEQIKLQLTPAGAAYTGSMELQGIAIPVSARPSSTGLDGRFRFENIDYTFQVRREGTVILLTSEGSTRRLEPVGKPSGNPLFSKPSNGTLVGSWTGPQGILRFNADGTGTGAGEAFQYEANGQVLTFRSGATNAQMAYSINGNSLRFTGPRGEVVMTRVVESSSGGGVMQELAGKWCYVANFNANAGASASSLCFVLQPDGRYEYSGESSSCNPNGAVASQSSDRGTWTATATTITSRSVTGKVTTSQLEKRNHPKNNDPMLVLDGQAFVTFYQKAPWR